jgi:hypothetical protein
LEKGKAIIFEGPRPNLSKPAVRWVKAQPGIKRKDPVVNLVRVSGMGLPDESLASTLSGAPSTVSPPSTAPIYFPEFPPVFVGVLEKISPVVSEVPENPETSPVLAVVPAKLFKPLLGTGLGFSD